MVDSVGDKVILSEVSPVFHKKVAVPREGLELTETVVLSPSQITGVSIVIVGWGAKYKNSKRSLLSHPSTV